MFDIIYSLFLEFIDMLSWYIPIMIVVGVIAKLIKGGSK